MRWAAGLLAVSAAVVGVWAEFFPVSFYRSFPLSGHSWVSPLGPYNEHLVRDVGGLYLALLAISLWAVGRADEEIYAMTGVAWEVFSVPHLVFHCAHLSMFARADRYGMVAALGGTVVLAGVLLPLRRRRT